MQSLFISYCWKDGNNYADELETQLKDKFDVKRDKSQLIANDDLYDFMAEIANCDQVVIVLTDAYVKSLNCMLEMSYLVKQPDWSSKATVLVIDESLYNSEKKLEIITYWLLRQKKISATLIETDIGSHIVQEEKNFIDEICDKIEEFFLGISRRKNPSQIAIVNEIMKRVGKNNPEVKQVITTREHQIIELLKENPGISLQDISRKLGVTMALSSRIIKGLEQKGLVKKYGTQKKWEYHIV